MLFVGWELSAKENEGWWIWTWDPYVGSGGYA